MRKQGHDVETIARELSKQRRALGVKYKDMTPPDKSEAIFERNIQKTGDKWGPTIDYFRNRGDSWEEIIEKAKKPGGKDLRGDFRR
ncbi:MAG: cell wall-binding protein [Alphaproteobacteria bacterium]|nr:MAG: cell wall-binding protein [Alphaproteobacteria bacterium]